MERSYGGSFGFGGDDCFVTNGFDNDFNESHNDGSYSEI